MPTAHRLARLRSVLERRQLDLEVVLENIHDAHNASAIVRSADAFGLGAVDLLYTDEEFPEISAGVSGHSRKWLTFHRYGDVAACVDALHERGLRVYATQVDPQARSYLEIDWTQPAAVILGNEQRGCASAVIAAADAGIWIPMQGMAQSLNVSVAAAVILAEAARQRGLRGLYEPRWDDERERLLRTWLEREEARGPGAEPPPASV